MIKPFKRLNSSFRDPDAFLFTSENILYRQLNISFKDDYEKLMKSGLYKLLVDKNWLLEHVECDETVVKDAWKIIKPTLLPFISYPYEWSFDQLKDAALLTLKIQRQSLEYGMSLKDASAFNVQHYNGQMVFIDTGSFQIYKDNSPWVAYKQFCEHFLAPLVLMQYIDINQNQLLKLYPDGIPLSLVKKLLPFKAKFNLGIFMHIFMHAANIEKHQFDYEHDVSKGLSISAQKKIIDNLYNIIKSLKPYGKQTQWQDYNKLTSYNEDGAAAKKEIISKWFKEISPSKTLDIGANNGYYSKLALSYSDLVIAADIDGNAVNSMWYDIKSNNIKNMIPVTIDLLNPTSGLGWNNNERESFIGRVRVSKPDCVMALALIHHLAISGHISFEMLALFFSQLTGEHFIIEWVPSEDHQSQKLIKSRGEQFSSYTKENFLSAMDKYFSISASENIAESTRTLYLFKRK